MNRNDLQSVDHANYIKSMIKEHNKQLIDYYRYMVHNDVQLLNNMILLIAVCRMWLTLTTYNNISDIYVFNSFSITLVYIIYRNQ